MWFLKKYRKYDSKLIDKCLYNKNIYNKYYYNILLVNEEEQKCFCLGISTISLFGLTLNNSMKFGIILMMVGWYYFKINKYFWI